MHATRTRCGESIAIVRAVTAMGRSLTTAEGVETLHQLETLRAEACDELQGYYFSRPSSCWT